MSQGGPQEFDINDLAGTPAIEGALFGGTDDAPPSLDLATAEPDIPPQRLPHRLGLPVGRPSRAERKRQARLRAEAASGGDDPFATLLTPLDDGEIDALRADLERDEVLFVRHNRARLVGERLHRLGTLFAVIVALLLAWPIGFWETYITTVNAQTPPEWISSWAGDWAGGIWMLAAVYAAIMWLILLGMTARGFGRLLVRPGFSTAAAVVAQIVLVIVVLALLAEFYVLASLTLATIGVIFAALASRLVFRSLVTGRRR